MISAMDMSAPVTRDELRAELDQRLAPLATKAEFLTIKADLEERVALLATKVELYAMKDELGAKLNAWGDRLMMHVSEEVARFAGVVMEEMARRISVVDDQYKDLPGRVNRLETVVFPPRPARKRRQ